MTCKHSYLVAAPDEVADPRAGLPGWCRKCGAYRLFAATHELALTPQAWNDVQWARRSTPKRLAEEVE